MKDKAIEIRDKIFKLMSDYTELHEIQDEIIQAMLEFGYYVAEEQKKQSNYELFYKEQKDYNKGDIHNSVNYFSELLLNSKNVCEQ